jgi:hypothetical protein
MGSPRKEIIERFDTVFGAYDRVANLRLFEGHDGEVGVVVVVLDQQDDRRAHDCGSSVK